jgi:transcriptional regulator with XRE-family HTH domain
MPRRRNDQLLSALGTRIQTLRVARGLTQEQMAQEVGLRPTTISRLECGSLSTGLANLALIAASLEVKLSELLDIESYVPPRETPVDEAELLRLYRVLDKEKKEIARRLIGELGRIQED